MGLAEDIRDLTGRTTTARNESHDYFTFTKRVWRLTEDVVDEGRRFSFRNQATGTRLNERSLVERSFPYFTGYQLPFSFQHFVSLLEEFLIGLLRHWLLAYPGSLSKKHVEFSAVLKAPKIG